MSEPEIDSTPIEMDSFTMSLRPVLTAEVDRGDSHGIYGGFDLALTSAEGDQLGSFRLVEKGLMPLDVGKSSYQTKLIRNEGYGTEMAYHIYPANPCPNEPFRPVLEIEYSAAGPVGQTVETADGESYLYAFPEGSLRLKPSEQIKLGRDLLAADREKNRGGGGELGDVVDCLISSGGGGGGG